ncbi:hypothetical protein JDM601_1391 [Mycolicibacter sinensis]|uniref:Uncharacterized protein n=1 Tax=Mycolicibacter sinensis (strain JDM601) TaxID=875328 RepID=F5YXC2_MYCSD|nr:hypothetical protein JDM601_1391 [Mycolicibacter sinensis]
MDRVERYPVRLSSASLVAVVVSAIDSPHVRFARRVKWR